MLRRALTKTASAISAPSANAASFKLMSTDSEAGKKRVLEPAPQTAFVVTPEGTKRPISPELAIWRFSNTAYLHVGHRITGCILSGGFILAGLYGLKSCDLPGAIDQIKIAAPLLVPVVKASVAFPLTYHLLGGYRQLYHDYTAKGLTAEFQDQSSMVMVAISGAITVIAAVVSYEEK